MILVVILIMIMSHSYRLNHTTHKTNYHRTFNNFLTIIVICIGCYILIVPFWPQITFWWRSKNHSKILFNNNSSDANQPQPIPKDNRIIAKPMQLDAAIYEGRYADTLKKGIWHRPNSSTPDKGSNTVIVGHRFSYSAPAIFYHLDKIQKDDQLTVYWQGKTYDYTVVETKVVEPNDTYIEQPTTKPTLTLYTCTPLWTSKQRLVVIAHLTEGVNQ